MKNNFFYMMQFILLAIIGGCGFILLVAGLFIQNLTPLLMGLIALTFVAVMIYLEMKK